MRAAAELAAVEPGALPAALAAESVPALTHAVWSRSEPVPVSEATARWASCGEAEIRRLVLDTDGIVTVLGRSARIADRNLRLRAALRDRWCRHPGCRVPATRCQLHHLTHWADGGRTRLEEMYCYCPAHHRRNHQLEALGLIRVTGTPDGDLDFWNGAVHLGTTRPQPLHRLPRPRPG